MDNVNSLHQVDLKILKEVLSICHRHNINYFALGGTMLGAVRHKGFIPWDDDIDLGMLREDYEKFIAVANRELSSEYRIVNFKNTPEFQYYITRVLDINTKVIENRIGNNNKYTFASIDIFPIDGTPNNKFCRAIYYCRVLFHRALMSLCYKDSIDLERKRSLIERIFLKFILKIPIEKFTNPQKEKYIIDGLLKSQKVEKSRFIGNIMGAYRTKEIVPKDWYGSGKLYEFEDIKIVGLEKAHEYLQHTYGCYMEYPPVENRKIHFTILSQEGES